jgi:uncharacterized protein YjiS (DUF1127 family)
MAFTTQTHAGISLADRFHAFRADFAEARAKRAQYRITRDELSKLTNSELADIGVNRSMITRIAMDAAGYK